MLTLEDELHTKAESYRTTADAYAGLEEKRDQLKVELAEAEKRLMENQAQRKKLESAYDALPLTQAVAAAFALKERSELLEVSGIQLYDQKNIAADRKVIKIYEENDLPVIRNALQAEYDTAKTREEQRQAGSSKVTAGIIARPGEEGIELYVSALFGERDKGLMRSLCEAVGNALIIAETTFEGPEEKEGIVRLAAASNYDSLLEALREQEPTGFRDANVEYKVVVVRSIDEIAAELGGRTTKEAERITEERVDGEAVAEMEIGRDDAGGDAGGKLNETDFGTSTSLGTAESRYREADSPNGGRVWTERIICKVADDRRYIPIKQSKAVTGMDHVGLYKHTDVHGKGIRTRKFGKVRHVELESLVAFTEERLGEPLRMLTVSQAAEIWMQEAERELGETGRSIESYKSHLGAKISHKELLTLRGNDGHTYLCKVVLNDMMVNYFARKKISSRKEPTISKDELAEILHTKMELFSRWTLDGKLVSDDNGNITQKSVNAFFGNYRYQNNSWIPKVVGPREKKQPQAG